MPFNEPYHEDFEDGDLVYGLSGPRGEWIFKHGATKGKNWIDKFSVDMSDVDASDAANIEFITETLKHPKYHCVMKTAGHDSSTQSKQHAWRTKSKAGLNWAVTKGKHVHFILDDLNMKDVAEKSNTKGNPDNPTGKAGSAVSQKDKVRTITNAELRWIYRNRNDPNTQKHIQFWLNDKPCCPPWRPEWDSGVGKKVAGNIAWEGYTPTREVT